MKITIQAAISVDGFVADKDGGTDWTRDLDLYGEACREYGIIAMGRATDDEFGGPAFEDVQQIVLSSQPKTSEHKNVHYVQTVEQAIAKAQELGFDKLLVIGGGSANGSLMRAGVVTNVSLDVHPLVLGQGTKLFGNGDQALAVSLHLESTKNYPDFVQLNYRIK